MPQLVLDTDIGSDVDDALALAVLLGSPDTTLLGVTTVYGDTTLRARLAARLIRLANPDLQVPVIPGAEATLSGRPVWWAGHEGTAFPDLADEPITADRSAAEFLTTTADQQPGTLDILAIGPLTNIADALHRDPRFADNLHHLYIMGGHFTDPPSAGEHNLLSDADAADTVFASSIPITVTGLEITTRVQLRQDDVEKIATAGPLGAALQREIQQWWRYHGHAWNNPHDPIAALTLLAPHHFHFTAHDVDIRRDSTATGQSIARPTTTRRTRITDGIDTAAVARDIVQRIRAAATNANHA